MTEKNNTGSERVQEYYVGMDVHKGKWVITIRCCGFALKTLVVDPSVEVLMKYLERNFPGGKFTCTYEAGFCGFWIARELKKRGVECLVVNPADVPTRDKERVNKKDKVDSRKLARELEKGNLEGIYIPDEWMQRLKSLGRLSISCGRDMTRIKNRIKSHLHLYGIEIPSHSECYHWSGNFIRALEGMCRKCDPFGDYMNACIEKLKAERARQAGLLKKLRGYANSCGWGEIIGRLISIPGIGFKTAITLMTEIEDMRRFKDLDSLCSFVGLIPSCGGSGDREMDFGITRRHNTYLRYLLVEAAWVIVRKDKVLLETYNKFLSRMTKQNAIIRIAKKLLGRIRYVWLNNKDYAYCKV